MKKIISSILISAACLVSIPKSDALIYLASEDESFVIYGGPCYGITFYATTAAAVVASIAIVSIILLDDNSVSVQLSPIDQTVQNQLKLTAAEVESYNTELEMLKTYSETVMSETKKLPTKEAKMAKAKLMWEDAKDSFSSESISALQKIMQGHEVR